jgi:riboflavin synthase
MLAKDDSILEFMPMFTGLVQTLAQVVAVRAEPPGRRLTVRAPEIADAAKIGDSIAVNGCCLTVIALEGGELAFEAGPETLGRTNLGELAAGGLVNLETSLAVGDRLGGHFVTGHIDGVGTVAACEKQGEWTTLWFSFPAALGRQLVSKGSIAVDGVSLTLVDVGPDRFSVQLIPHTLAATTLGRRAVGDRVNLETDLLAKYVQRLAVIQ